MTLPVRGKVSLPGSLGEERVEHVQRELFEQRAESGGETGGARACVARTRDSAR